MTRSGTPATPSTRSRPRRLDAACRTLAAALGRTLRHGLETAGERVHAFTHLSHVYPSGSSLYATYVFRLAPTRTRRWSGGAA